MRLNLPSIVFRGGLAAWSGTLIVLLGLLPCLWAAAAQPEFGPAKPGSPYYRAPAPDGSGGDAGRPLDRIVAVVQDDIITRSELDSATRSILAQLRRRGVTPPAQDELERQVLERLILGRLQMRAAEQSGIQVDDAAVNAALEDIARRNNLSLSQLRRTVEADGLDFDDFREDIRREITTAQLRQRVVDSRIRVTDEEVDSLLSGEQGEDRQFRLAQILIAVPENASAQRLEQARRQVEQVLEQLRRGADFGRLAATVSDGRQALEGGDLGWRSTRQLPRLFAQVVPRLSPGQVSPPIRSPSGFHLVKLLEVRGAQQQLVTETRARHILITPDQMVSDQEARRQLERLADRIDNGADFAELARANSDDTTSAVQGGDLGWVGPGDLVPQFETVMNRLAPGQVSEPFKTRFGWHIVQVQDRRRRDNTDEARRAAARQAIGERRSEEEWETYLRQLRDEAYVEVRL